MLQDFPNQGVLHSVMNQLDFIRQTTEDKKIPTVQERKKINLALLALRIFEDSNPDYAELLYELDYAFNRYDKLLEKTMKNRRAMLQVKAHSKQLKEIILEFNTKYIVGSADEADIVLTDYPLVPKHFEVYWDGITLHIMDCCNGEPMLINGNLGWSGELAEGEELIVNETIFRFKVY